MDRCSPWCTTTYQPETLAAQRVIDAGEIGTVRTVTVNFLGIVDVPGNAGYAPCCATISRTQAAVINWTSSMASTSPSCCLASRWSVSLAWADSTSPGSNVEDIALCLIRDGEQSRSGQHCLGLRAGGLEVTGTEGRIVAQFLYGGTSPWSPLYVFLSQQHRAPAPNRGCS